MSPLRRLAPLLAAVLVGPALAALTSGPAAAACAMPQAPREALAQRPSAFVGIVTAVRGADRVATFDVQEIWKGPNVADPVTVYGGPEDPSVWMEDARTWKVGLRYLVFPTVASDGNLTDSLCGPTVPYTSELDGLRPATAHPPQGPPTSGPPGDPPIAAVFLLVLVLGSVGAFLLLRAGYVKPTP